MFSLDIQIVSLEKKSSDKKISGFAWEGRHPGAFTIGFYSTSRPAGDQTRGREIETNMTKILVFHRVFMTLRTKIVISWLVFDTDISKPFVFVLKMQQKTHLFFASRWVAGAEIPTGIKKTDGDPGGGRQGETKRRA